MEGQAYNHEEQMKRKDIVFASTSSFNLPIRITSICEWRVIGLIMLKMQADFGKHKFQFRNKTDLKDQYKFLKEVRMRRLSFDSQFREDEIEIVFPLRFLCSEGSSIKSTYQNTKRALKNLSRPVEVENKKALSKLTDKKCKDNTIIWGLYQVIEKPDIRKFCGENYVYMRIPQTTWEVLCNWKEGVHIFELSVFFRLELPASIPFYILLADYRKDGVVIWPTKYIKDIIAPGKYRDYAGFRKQVIEPVEKDLKKNAPFYFEYQDFVDKDCRIPSRQGRGRAANFGKFVIRYQPEKNPEVDSRIGEFIELNRMEAFRLEDLSAEERTFLAEKFEITDIKGKNLETIVKLKYYKNFGHQNVKVWRTHPGNYFMVFLNDLYKTILLKQEPLKSVAAYAMSAIQKVLESYEPVKMTFEEEVEKENRPERKQDEVTVLSARQDMEWLAELSQDKQWIEATSRNFGLEGGLGEYLVRFRDHLISSFHQGHKSKRDLALHFMSLMDYQKDGTPGWAGPYKEYSFFLRSKVTYTDQLSLDFKD